MEFDRMECEKKDSVLDPGNLRIRKYNRTTLVMEGKFRITRDLDNTYEVRDIKI